MDLVNDMKLDKSLENLDPVKMLLFFLVFVAISLIVIFVFIVPSVKEYKSVKVQYNRHEVSLNRMEEVLSSKKNILQKELKQNSHILNSLSNGFNKSSFLTYAKKFFKDVKVTKVSTISSDKGYSVYELNVTSAIDSPSSFYSFLDGLKSYENIIKADFPITMKADGKMINSNFNIKVYNQK